MVLSNVSCWVLDLVSNVVVAVIVVEEDAEVSGMVEATVAVGTTVDVLSMVDFVGNVLWVTSVVSINDGVVCIESVVGGELTSSELVSKDVLFAMILVL